jgi:hypothetical protein
VCDLLQRTHDLRQLGGTELAGSTSAVAEGSQTNIVRHLGPR